jgi:hypothetical protein
MNSKKYIVLHLSLSAFICLFIISSCKKNIPAPIKTNYSLTEQFSSLTTAEANGWIFINNSRALGQTTWQAGEGSLFAAYTTDAAASDYVAIAASCCNPFDVDGNFTPQTEISAWMITPVLTVKDGDTISFYTRTTDAEPFDPERLQLRMNPTGTGTDVGNDSSSVGEFTQIVLDINPGLIPGEYPNTWTRFQYIISGLSAQTKTRFAFRYYKPITTLGAASFYYELGYIGIDDFSFSSL